MQLSGWHACFTCFFPETETEKRTLSSPGLLSNDFLLATKMPWLCVAGGGKQIRLEQVCSLHGTTVTKLR